MPNLSHLQWFQKITSSGEGLDTRFGPRGQARFSECRFATFWTTRTHTTSTKPLRQTVMCQCPKLLVPVAATFAAAIPSYVDIQRATFSCPAPEAAVFGGRDDI